MQSSDVEVVDVQQQPKDSWDAWKYAFPRPGQTKADTKLPRAFKAKMHLNGLQATARHVSGTSRDHALEDGLPYCLVSSALHVDRRFLLE